MANTMLKTGLIVGAIVVPLAAFGMMSLLSDPQADITLTLTATSRQIVARYTAPDTSPCTLEVSESNTYSPVVNDVNTTLFTGANSDDRIGSVGTGTTSRVFIAGSIQQPNGTISNLALDSKRYSRTLQTNTTHYIRVTCGSHTGTGSIATRNIPLGKTYVEPLPVAGAGSYAFPTVNDVDRSESFIDPVYGTLLRKISVAAEDLYVADGGGQIRCATAPVNDGSSTPGYLCMFPTNGGAAQLYWINTANGDSRYLGQPVLRSGTLADMPTTYLAASPESKFGDSRTYYQISLDFNQDANSNPHVIRCTLPASGNSVYNTSVSAGTDAPCTWGDMTPNPNNLAALNLAFDPTFDRTKFNSYYRQSVDGGYFAFNVLRGNQDSYGWVGLFSLASNPITSVTALMPMWKRGGPSTSCRWCGIHGSGQIQGSGGNIFLTPKTMYQGGGVGQGPYTVSLSSNMTSSQTTITFNSNTPTSPNADTTLYGIAAGDEIGVPNNDGEHMLITAFVSGTTWTVTRAVFGTAITHNAGDGVIMACRSHRTGDITEGITDYWNAPANPTGNDTTNTNLVRFDDGFSGHGGRGLLRWISEAGYSACSNLSTITAPCAADFIIDDSPAFSGAIKSAAGNTYQKHPSPPDQLNAASDEQVWGLDGFVNDADGLESSPTSFTNVTGTLFKFVNTNYTLNRKKLPMLAIVGGAHPLLDVSSTATGNVIGGTSGDNYKYCIANAVNECRTGSIVGDVYINGPSLTTGSNCPTGNLSQSDVTSICFGHLPAWAQTINQIGIVLPDSTGKYVRSLTSGMAGIKTAGTNNAEMTPDGKWAWFPRDISGSRIAFMVKIPPFPAYDGLNRNTFMQKAVTIPALGGADNAIIEFGYDLSFNCTSRNEVCVSANGNNPFFFASESYTGISCASGCAVNIPMIPDRVAYYRIKWRSGSTVVQTSGVQVVSDTSAPIPPTPTPTVTVTPTPTATPTPTPTPIPTPTPVPTPTPTPLPTPTPGAICKPNQLISSGCTCLTRIIGPPTKQRCK